MAVLPGSVLDLLSNFVHKSVKVLSISRTVTGDQYVPGSGEFRGPAASPQRFANEGGHCAAGCAPHSASAFEAFYTRVDGRPVKVPKLAVQTPAMK
jgi:hypothetical protein